MSIHQFRAPFIRCNFKPSFHDSQPKRNHPKDNRPYGQPFWASIVGTETERKLAAMLNRKEAA